MKKGEHEGDLHGIEGRKKKRKKNGKNIMVYRAVRKLRLRLFGNQKCLLNIKQPSTDACLTPLLLTQQSHYIPFVDYKP